MIETGAALAQLQDLVDEGVKESPVPGFLAGVWWDGHAVEVASGTANLNTGEPMTSATGFLLGSITKVMVTTALMRFVERGAIRLDDRVIDHLPELRLGDPAALEALRIRHLLNHSSGIDATNFVPELGVGEDVMRRYVALLADKGQLFPVGSHISYSNVAFSILGRVLEVLSGDDFHTVLRREVFEPVGMDRTCTSADEAILHRTAVGHILDPETRQPRPVRRFMMTRAIAPAGSTVITTLGNLLRFACVHLQGGRTPEGTRVLSEESVVAMRTETIREEELGGLAFGLGWMQLPYGSARLLRHGGASYGGTASLIVVPEKRFAYAAFANAGGGASASIHPRVEDFVLREVLGLDPPALVARSTAAVDPARYSGTFAQSAVTTRISPRDDGGLVATTSGEGEEYLAMLREMIGRDELPPSSLRAVTPSFFVPSALAEQPVPLHRVWMSGMTFLDPDAHGRFRYISQGGRIARRID